MKRTLLLLYCLFSIPLSFAQNQGFKVSVLDDTKEPLPGAHVFINKKPFDATDSLGQAVIPIQKLKTGDIISISYIASKDLTLKVDNELLEKGECQFVMSENFSTLHAAQVNVKANIKRLYRKNLPIKRLPPYQYYSLYSAHFTINKTNPDDSIPEYWVAGRAEGAYISLYFNELMFPTKHRSTAVHARNPNNAVIDSLLVTIPRVGFMNDVPLKIITNDDTTNLSNTLKYYIPRVLQANKTTLERVYKPEPNYIEIEIYPNLKAHYGYLGKDQDSSKFNLTYSGHGAGTTSKIEVVSDATDWVNRELLEATLSFEDTIKGASYYVRSIVRKDRIDEDDNVPVTYQVPDIIEARFKENDGTIVNITMSNIHFRSAYKASNVDFWYIFSLNPSRFQNQRTKKWKMHALRSFYYDEANYYLDKMINDEKKLIEKKLKKTKT